MTLLLPGRAGGFDPESWIARGAERALVQIDRAYIEHMGLHGFVQLGWGTVQPEATFRDNWHIAAICEHLEAVSSTSFPSGHATAAASIYLSMAFVAARGSRHPGLLLAGAGAFAAAVGASRVYLGVHWPTDVVSGLAIGTAWACGTEALVG